MSCVPHSLALFVSCLPHSPALFVSRVPQSLALYVARVSHSLRFLCVLFASQRRSLCVSMVCLTSLYGPHSLALTMPLWQTSQSYRLSTPDPFGNHRLCVCSDDLRPVVPLRYPRYSFPPHFPPFVTQCYLLLGYKDRQLHRGQYSSHVLFKAMHGHEW